MKNTWLCPKCNISSANTVNRCSFCATPKPEEQHAAEIKISNYKEHNLRKSLHYQIEHVNFSQLNRIWKFMEDTIL